MPERGDSTFYVTEPLEFAFDADGNVEIALISKARRFVFTASRYRCRNANAAMRRMLDAADLEQTGRVRTFKTVQGGEGGH